jgi:hypothetical protein
VPTSLDVFAPFDSGTGANVTEATWRDFMRHMLGSASGVIRGFLNEFAVTAAGTGMNVSVNTGEAWIRGHYGKSTAAKTLPITAAHATLPRKDRVILRADFTNNRVELDVLAGTAASTPITPSVTQSSTVWEVSLAVVDIPAGDTVITTSQITDDRVYTTVHGKFTSTTNQTITNSSYNKVQWNTVLQRSGDLEFDNANDQFTLQRSGLWTLSASVRFTASTAIPSKRELILADPATVSGSTTTNILAGSSTAGSSGEELQVSCTTTERFAAGQIVAVFVFQSTGSGLLTFVGANQPQFSAVWVGP